MLTRMLVPAPYQVSAKEDKEESKKAKGGPKEIGTPSSEDERKDKLSSLLPMGRRGPPLKTQKEKLLSGGRYPSRGMMLTRSHSIKIGT